MLCYVVELQQDGDETVVFRLRDPQHGNALKLGIMFPDLGGYPIHHSQLCYAQTEQLKPGIEDILSEVAT